MSALVGNPEDRFSHNEPHFLFESYSGLRITKVVDKIKHILLQKEKKVAIAPSEISLISPGAARAPTQSDQSFRDTRYINIGSY